MTCQSVNYKSGSPIDMNATSQVGRGTWLVTFTPENLSVHFCQSVLANSCEIDSLADPIRRALDADAVGAMAELEWVIIFTPRRPLITHSK